MRRLLLAATLLAGCEDVVPGVDWQQMVHQHKVVPYGACDLFADGRALQPPPPGTVARDALGERPAESEGRALGRYVDRIPIPLTPKLIQSGRRAYDITCAACHGADGSGRSPVAEHMELRKPPSLTEEPVRSFPDGRLFQVITQGYGLMPAYEEELAGNERWAVVAYVRALELAKASPLAELPPDVRAATTRALAATEDQP